MTDLRYVSTEDLNERINRLIVEVNDPCSDSIGSRYLLNQYEQEMQSRLADEAMIRQILPPVKED